MEQADPSPYIAQLQWLPLLGDQRLVFVRQVPELMRQVVTVPGLPWVEATLLLPRSTC